MQDKGWTKCLGCGRVMPEHAEDCPHCGRRVSNRRDIDDDRRGGEERRQVQLPIEGPERRKAPRRKGKDRRTFAY